MRGFCFSEGSAARAVIITSPRPPGPSSDPCSVCRAASLRLVSCALCLNLLRPVRISMASQWRNRSALRNLHCLLPREGPQSFCVYSPSAAASLWLPLPGVTSLTSCSAGSWEKSQLGEGGRWVCRHQECLLEGWGFDPYTALPPNTSSQRFLPAH